MVEVSDADFFNGNRGFVVGITFVKAGRRALGFRFGGGEGGGGEVGGGEEGISTSSASGRFGGGTFAVGLMKVGLRVCLGFGAGSGAVGFEMARGELGAGSGSGETRVVEG